MNNLILRKITVTANYQPLVNGALVASVTILAPSTNTGPVFFKGDDGGDVPWSPGAWAPLVRVNLADLQVKGNAGDVITLVGGSW